MVDERKVLTANGMASPEEEGGMVDAALLTRFVKKGEREALGKLFERHSAWMYRLAVTLVCSKAAAEDAVQNAFLGVIRTAANFDPARASVRQWMAGILFNVCRLQKRGAANLTKREKAAGEEYALTQRDRAEKPDDSEELDEVKQELRRAVEQLPENIRVPLMLRFYEGFTVQEAAASLGLREPTLRARLRRGLVLLRQRLEHEGVSVGSLSVVAGLLAAMPLPSPPVQLTQAAVRTVLKAGAKGQAAISVKAAGLRAVAASPWSWAMAAVLSAVTVVSVVLQNRPAKSPPPKMVAADTAGIKIYLDLAAKLRTLTPPVDLAAVNKMFRQRLLVSLVTEERPSAALSVAITCAWEAAARGNQQAGAQWAEDIRFTAERIEAEARAMAEEQARCRKTRSAVSAAEAGEAAVLQKARAAMRRGEYRRAEELLREEKGAPADFLRANLYGVRGEKEKCLAALAELRRRKEAPWSTLAVFPLAGVRLQGRLAPLLDDVAFLAAEGEREAAAGCMFAAAYWSLYQRQERRRVAWGFLEKLVKEFPETAYAEYYREHLRQTVVAAAKEERRMEEALDLAHVETAGPGTWKVVPPKSPYKEAVIEYSGGDGSPATLVFKNVRTVGAFFTTCFGGLMLSDAADYPSLPPHLLSPVRVSWLDAVGGGKRTVGRMSSRMLGSSKRLSDVVFRLNVRLQPTRDAQTRKIRWTVADIMGPITGGKRLPPRDKALPPLNEVEKDARAPFGLGLRVKGVRRAWFSALGLRRLYSGK